MLLVTAAFLCCYFSSDSLFALYCFFCRAFFTRYFLLHCLPHFLMSKNIEHTFEHIQCFCFRQIII
ncbi:TPA: hypothetical protein DIC20_04680 [Candidatus Dependentiae bacterium]|nr:hypothetical protein [Candidatus Dependentiae bacterium]HCU00970.1 hypothetical protein [Candidatus Dependentiae bacterium]